MFNEYIEIAGTYLNAWGISIELAGLIVIAAVWLLLYMGSGLSFFRFLMRWYQRLIILAGLIALGFWLFYIGREHRIFLDNKAVNDYKPLELVRVSVNGGKAVELTARDRDMRKVVGPEFEFKAEICNGDGEVLNTITKTMKIGCSKDIMISLPMLAEGTEDFVIPSPR